MKLLRLLTLLVVLGAVIAYASRRDVVPRGDVLPPAGGSSSVGGTLDLDSVRAHRQRILRQIAESDTYLPAMLAEGDSMLRRWPERRARPLSVFLEEGAVPGYSEQHAQAVRDAFGRWGQVAGVPVLFRFARDSTDADVRVRWVRSFPLRRAGQADVVWNHEGWLIRATLTLATHTNDGHTLSPGAVHTVALHEIGHVLGLGHSESPEDVMFPTTSVHDLTFRDRHTARLLYSLPPGSLKVPRAGP